MAKGWSFGSLVAALKGAAFKDVAASAELKAGTGDNVPSVEAVMSLLPKKLWTADFNGAAGGTQDYIRIPDIDGGLIVQFGVGVITATSGVVTLPTPFPTKFCTVVATKRGGDSRYVTVSARPPLPLGAFGVFGWYGGGAPAAVDTFTWVAIGY